MLYSFFPSCAATAFAEEDRIITIYKPIAETDVESFVLEGGLNTQRTGTWTTNGQTKEASYRPTARMNKDALFDYPIIPSRLMPKMISLKQVIRGE